ncbi:hypothetical protein DAPPUDRAFT_241933 [Daphnia pulex]|uniref:Uncharacterized protein n=1 Tax=Daphnia pulex TaxID=6669 RepID=E9GFF1_DAPPU|nr:hypothetical protein DAPPUDRAFT_241933 [Daphnia pulex]|eukprot:EFX81824.1 hypothetical protein DAPPUDRAFT_241933 [Daphnia pulex]
MISTTWACRVRHNSTRKTTDVNAKCYTTSGQLFIPSSGARTTPENNTPPIESQSAFNHYRYSLPSVDVFETQESQRRLSMSIYVMHNNKAHQDEITKQQQTS